MWKFLKANMTREDVATCLQAIVDGEDWIWSDFTDVPIQDPELDKIRVRVLALEDSHPPTDASSYLNADGNEIVRSIIQELRSGVSGGRS